MKNSEDSSDEDQEVGAEDSGVASSSRGGKAREQDYSEDEEEEKDSDSEQEEEEEKSPSPTMVKQESEGEEEKSEPEVQPKVNKPKVHAPLLDDINIYDGRVNAVLRGDKFNYVDGNAYDENKEEWCEVIIRMTNKFISALLIRLFFLSA